MAIVSGLAPGRFAKTVIVGYSTSGSGSQWKKGVGQRAEQEQAHAQQGCRHRPPNKGSRDIHSWPPPTFAREYASFSTEAGDVGPRLACEVNPKPLPEVNYMQQSVAGSPFTCAGPPGIPKHTFPPNRSLARSFSWRITALGLSPIDDGNLPDIRREHLVGEFDLWARSPKIFFGAARGHHDVRFAQY